MLYFRNEDNKKKGKLKVYSASEYIYYDSTDQSFKLDSDDSVATEFNFCTDWGHAPGTEFTVDLYVDDLEYLQAGSTALTPHFGTIDYDTYKWRLIPVPTQ